MDTKSLLRASSYVKWPRAPLVPAAPIAGVVVNPALMAGLGPISWAAFLTWMAGGPAIDLSYSHKHTALQ